MEAGGVKMKERLARKRWQAQTSSFRSRCGTVWPKTQNNILSLDLVLVFAEKHSHVKESSQ